MLVDRLFDEDRDALVAVCGAFNTEADEVPLRAIRGDVEDNENPQLAGRVLVPCEHSVLEPTRFSLFHHGKAEMIDPSWCRARSWPSTAHTEIHNEILHDESSAFATDVKFPNPTCAGDH
jgi:hypothetical protein